MYMSRLDILDLDFPGDDGPHLLGLLQGVRRKPECSSPHVTDGEDATGVAILLLQAGHVSGTPGG